MRTERVFEHRKGFAIFPVADQHATFGEEAVSAALDTGGCSKAATFFKRAKLARLIPLTSDCLDRTFDIAVGFVQTGRGYPILLMYA